MSRARAEWCAGGFQIALTTIMAGDIPQRTMVGLFLSRVNLFTPRAHGCTDLRGARPRLPLCRVEQTGAGQQGGEAASEAWLLDDGRHSGWGLRGRRLCAGGGRPSAAMCERLRAGGGPRVVNAAHAGLNGQSRWAVVAGHFAGRSSSAARLRSISPTGVFCLAIPMHRRPTAIAGGRYSLACFDDSTMTSALHTTLDATSSAWPWPLAAAALPSRSSARGQDRLERCQSAVLPKLQALLGGLLPGCPVAGLPFEAAENLL